jgi:hypothetical protein
LQIRFFWLKVLFNIRVPALAERRIWNQRIIAKEKDVAIKTYHRNMLASPPLLLLVPSWLADKNI